MVSEDLARELGSISAKLEAIEKHQKSYDPGAVAAKLEAIKENQDRHEGKLDHIDGRLRSIETKSALTGGVAGGVMSVGIAMIMEFLKSKG